MALLFFVVRLEISEIVAEELRDPRQNTIDESTVLEPFISLVVVVRLALVIAFRATRDVPVVLRRARGASPERRGTARLAGPWTEPRRSRFQEPAGGDG